MRILVAGDDGPVYRVIASALGLYRGFPFESDDEVTLVIKNSAVSPTASGSYLTCARMLVDREDTRWLASTRSGIGAMREHDADVWTVWVPRVEFDEPTIGDVEDILSLVLTQHWREGGWLPVHAGCVVSPQGRAAFLCATSGGGKSTLTSALVREGWGTLGDDKLLICRASGDVFSLCGSFNLAPHSANWFPELERINSFPRYSAWTEKRRVFVEDFWPGRLTLCAQPGRVIKIVRDDATERWGFERLSPQETLAAMLDQIVIPNDRSVAKGVVATLSRLTSRLQGHTLHLGSKAYESGGIAAAMETELS